jgi:hypothetical protein
MIERQTKLHSELYKIKKSNEAEESGASSVQGATEGNVGGSNAATQPIN